MVMIVGEKMSAIANLIRTILGTTEKMGVDAIATNLESILTGLENALHWQRVHREPGQTSLS
jgi:hypothetical protein